MKSETTVKTTVVTTTSARISSIDLNGLLRRHFNVPENADMHVFTDGGGSYCGEEVEIGSFGAIGLMIEWITTKTNEDTAHGGS